MIYMKFKSKYLNETDEKKFIGGLLSTSLSKRKGFKRCVSTHIGSRWYRAPEVCLVEK